MKELLYFYDCVENDVTDTEILEEYYNDYELFEEYDSFDSWFDSLFETGRLEEISKREYNRIREDLYDPRTEKEKRDDYLMMFDERI